MIAPETALQIILEHARVLETQTIAHGDALGRVLARDVISEIELPPFDNSAMDGYAVQSNDVRDAS